MEETVPYNLNQLGIRARSKRELYLVLLNDWEVYMPPLQDSNAGYVRGVITGTGKGVSLLLSCAFFSSSKQYTVIPFVIFSPKSDDFTDFCEGENDNGQQKIFEKLFWKFYLILLKLYSKIHNFLTFCV